MNYHPSTNIILPLINDAFKFAQTAIIDKAEQNREMRGTNQI